MSEYAELKEQASGFDSLQLYLERKALRPDREKAAAQRIEAAYGDKFSWWLMESGLRAILTNMHRKRQWIENCGKGGDRSGLSVR